jgi:hypothetical protein
VADNDKVGQVSVQIFARVGDGPEVDLGTAFVPITRRQMSKNHLDVDLDEVFDVTKQTLQRIYAE